ncbi:MAG: hypothetical protein ACXV95_16310, partial [Acidimicrobiales bacterium]
RVETRGSHWREDRPDRDDAAWLGHVVARLDGGTLTLGYRPHEKGREGMAPR